MVSSAIMYVSFLLLVTSFVAVEWRNLFAAVHTYQVQSVLIALTFALYAHSLHNPALYYWSAVALLSKDFHPLAAGAVCTESPRGGGAAAPERKALRNMRPPRRMRPWPVLFFVDV